VRSGPDGHDITAKVDGHLDYVSQLAKQLGLDDPVETYLTPLVGRWSDLRDEAERWRTAARAAEDVTHRLTTPLGGLDAAWQGHDADSFVTYMQQVGLAGNDMSDAMNAMAEALDKTADGIRQIVQEMVDLLTDTAEQSSDAMTVPVAGQSRAAQYLDELDRPVKQLHHSVRDVLQAFTKLCQGVQDGQSFDGITMAHTMPTRDWAPTTPPTTPVPVHHTTPAAAHPAPAPVTHAAAAAHPAAHPAAAHPAAAHPSVGTAPAAAAHAAHAAAPAAAHVAHTGGGAPVTGHPAGDVSAQQTGPPAQSGAMADPTTGSISGQLPVLGGAGGQPGVDGAQGGQQGGMPMGGMGGGMKPGGGGDQQHKPKTRLSGDVKDIFGKPDRTAPPTIGGKG
jgi:uncharacterized protein YukE